MALDTNATKLAQLINPQVLADMIEKKLVDAIKISSFCRIDNTLVGRPGNTVTLPSYAYIGDAVDVVEGADIPISQLTESSTPVTVKKAGKGVQITDEAVLSGYGDPMGEIASQIQLAIRSKVETDLYTTLSGIASNMTHTITGTTITPDDVADALLKFGEDLDGDKAIVVSPAIYNTLRKANGWIPGTEMAADIIVKGAVGMIHGCQVVVSNRLTGGKNAYIIKPGALAIYLKRDIAVESDRDIINKSTVVTADKHYVTYLYDASKAIKIVHA